MKKIAFLFVAVVALSACGNKSANNEAAEEGTVEVVETVVEVADSAATDSIATDSTACCGGENHKTEEAPAAE